MALPLLASLLLGLAAVYVVYIYVQGQIRQISGGIMTPVVFSSQEIPEGTTIKDSMLSVKNVPASFLHFLAVKAQDKQFLIGQQTSAKVGANQGVLWSEISLPTNTPLADQLKTNQRALTIPASSSTGINGLIRPGDHVDIIATYTVPQSDFSQSDVVTKMLLQDISVLAVDGRMSGARPGGSAANRAVSNITLRVSPEQAMLLSFSEQKTDLRIVLRSRQDIIEGTFPPVTFSTVTGLVDAPAQAITTKAPAPGFPAITQGQGNQQSGFFPTAQQQTPSASEPALINAAQQILSNMQRQADTPAEQQILNTVRQSLEKVAPAQPQPTP